MSSSDLPLGTYSGAVTASDDAAVVSLTTPVGAVVERPKVTLTIRTLNREGQPMGGEYPWAGGSPAGWAETPSNVTAMDVEGIAGYAPEDLSLKGPSIERVRVVPGTYSTKRSVRWWDDRRQDMVTGELVDAQVEVDADTTVVLDARDAVPVTWSLPRRTARAPQTMLSFEIGVWDGRLSTTTGSTPFDYVTPTEEVTANTFVFGVHTDQNTNPQATMALVTGRRRTPVPLVPRFRPSFADQGLVVGVEEPVAWHPFPAGRHRLQLVDAGFGHPEDLEGVDLRGKLALLRWSEQRHADIDINVRRCLNPAHADKGSRFGCR